MSTRKGKRLTLAAVAAEVKTLRRTLAAATARRHEPRPERNEPAADDGVMTARCLAIAAYGDVTAAIELLGATGDGREGNLAAAVVRAQRRLADARQALELLSAERPIGFSRRA